jgi:hypothetical protein
MGAPCASVYDSERSFTMRYNLVLSVLLFIGCESTAPSVDPAHGYWVPLQALFVEGAGDTIAWYDMRSIAMTRTPHVFRILTRSRADTLGSRRPRRYRVYEHYVNCETGFVRDTRGWDQDSSGQVTSSWSLTGDWDHSQFLARSYCQEILP